VHLFSASVKVEGGVVVDVTEIDNTTVQGWADYHGVKVEAGELIVYKAVNDELESSRGFAYPIGEMVTDPVWAPGDFCGNGLHFSPAPHQALDYYPSATRFLEVAIPADACSVIAGNDLYSTPKIKAKSGRVLREVDVNGRPV